MADKLAANGYKTLIIDIFNGDPVKLNRPDSFDFFKWVNEGYRRQEPAHQGVHRPHRRGCLEGAEGEARSQEDWGSRLLLRSQGKGTEFSPFPLGCHKDGCNHAGVNLLISRRNVSMLHATTRTASTSATSPHPSFVDEEELAAITGPVHLRRRDGLDLPCREAPHKSEEILQKTGLPYQINLFSGVRARLHCPLRRDQQAPEVWKGAGLPAGCQLVQRTSAVSWPMGDTGRRGCDEAKLGRSIRSNDGFLLTRIVQPPSTLILRW